MKNACKVLWFLLAAAGFSCKEAEDVAPAPPVAGVYVGMLTTKTLSDWISSGTKKYYVGTKARLIIQPNGTQRDSLLAIDFFTYHGTPLYKQHNLVLQPDRSFRLDMAYEDTLWEVRVSGKITPDSLYYVQEFWYKHTEYKETTQTYKGTRVRD